MKYAPSFQGAVGLKLIPAGLLEHAYSGVPHCGMVRWCSADYAVYRQREREREKRGFVPPGRRGRGYR